MAALVNICIAGSVEDDVDDEEDIDSNTVDVLPCGTSVPYFAKVAVALTAF